LEVGADRTGPTGAGAPFAVGFASPVNGTIEKPVSGTMEKDDLDSFADGEAGATELLGDGAGDETICGDGLGMGARGVVAGCGVGGAGTTRGVVAGVGIFAELCGLRGTPLVRPVYRVVVT
jgi:hypothetical protein